MAHECMGPPDTYKAGMKGGLDLAMEHIQLQHTVWDHTTVPPKVLLDMLVRNLQALKDLK